MSVIKVLWFANTPCGASEKLDPLLKIGGWLKSLDEAISMDSGIELHIGFYWDREMSPFQIGSTRYHPILRESQQLNLFLKARKLFNIRIFEKVEVNRLRNLIQVVQPDLVHIHGTEDNFGLVQEGLEVPALVSIQGILSPYSEKFYSGIPRSIATRFEPLINVIRRRSVARQFEKFTFSAVREQEILALTRHVVGRTDWDRRVTRVLAPNATYHTGNEIIRRSFYKHKWSHVAFRTPVRLVSTMSGGLYKGLENIVKTAKLLQRRGVDFQWTVIGQTERASLPTLVKRWLKIDYNKLGIELVGSKSESEIISVLLDSDVYCQVSHIENSPNSLCEAMLLGMPIVASYVGGTDSMLENRREGILVQDGDPYSLAGALIEVVESMEIAKSMGENARRRAHTRHSIDEVKMEYLRIYQRIVSKRSSGA